MSAPVQATPVAVFKSTVAYVDEGPFPTFKEALNNFITRIKAARDANTLSLQVLETMCWIERIDDNIDSPLMYYDVIRFAVATNLMVGDGSGNLNAEAPEPDADLLHGLYMLSLDSGLTEMILRDLKRTISNLGHPATKETSQ